MTDTNQHPTAKNAAMESTLLLGHSADWWNGAMLLSLGLAALVAFLVAGATTGAVVSAGRETRAAKDALERYKVSAKRESDIAIGRVRSEAEQKIQAARNDADVKIGQANAKASEADARAAEANLELAKIKSPRSLTPEQSKSVLAAIKPFAGQKFTLSVSPGDEAFNFLEILEKILSEAKWAFIKDDNASVTTVAGTSNNGEGTTVSVNLTSGINIRCPVEECEKLFPAMAALGNALVAAGIDVKLAKDPNFKMAGALSIMVGGKPLK